MKRLKPNTRKLVVTAHLAFAIGWLGAVAAFLALAILGITSADQETTTWSALAMEFIANAVIVPLSLAPLITGPILSLGTPWGLFRHYWIVLKLFITIASTLIMQLHIQPIQALALAAQTGELANGSVHDLQVQMVAASAAALLALLFATGLGVYKPRGTTPWAK